MELVVVRHLQDVLNHLEGKPSLTPIPVEMMTSIEVVRESGRMDFRHIIGHERAKRALLIAASGEHNVLMSGPPGCGKSMLAEAFSSILPTLTKDKQLEVMSLRCWCLSPLEICRKFSREIDRELCGEKSLRGFLFFYSNKL
jgi:magnesium chelatase family protein